MMAYAASLASGIPPEDILSESRRYEIVKPRRVVFYLIRKYLPMSRSAEFMEWHHTTVIHGHKTTENMMVTYDEVRDLVEQTERWYLSIKNQQINAREPKAPPPNGG